MTRRKVLQDLFYDAYGIIEDNGRDSKEGDDRIDQALADLAQIEESERLTEEEIEKVLYGCRIWKVSNKVEIKEASQAIHEAQERKIKGGKKC